ncbi:hypothetical protein AUEXF2481DRAFT_701782, partial [Aureobasidium subglaciale EXF-2481]
PCTQTHFETACADKSCWPSKCCSSTPIPLSFAETMLTPDAIAQVLRRTRDWRDPLNSNTLFYCANPRCSHDLARDEEYEVDLTATIVTCPVCASDTCSACSISPILAPVLSTPLNLSSSTLWIRKSSSAAPSAVSSANSFPAVNT